ncbi:MAG: hypothetical protein VB081_14780 [Christensenella sp.]|uniref:hypothetical protein n=1 Tax=Christensenella sp. TaxID=1935934 RepID=UPI002B1F4A22|nr:hypothetical protein [Christensenella sp.]MEA5004750.1 hypothetical protein [Christensenella sp.]
MEWILIGILIIAILAGSIIKMVLRRKLKNIDGMNGTHVSDQNRIEENIIGKLGNDEKH